MTTTTKEAARTAASVFQTTLISPVYDPNTSCMNKLVSVM
jgi:hypothetical protein